MKTGILLTTTALILLPLGLQAQQGSVRTTASADARAEMRSGNSETAEGRIDSALLMAFEAGIPAHVLESKVEEGTAKGVPADRIAAAVEARLDALLRARTLMEERSGEAGGEARGDVALLVATADALQANVDAEALARVWGASSGESRLLATATATQLVRLGHSSADAAMRVTGALQSGGSALTDLSASATAALQGRGGLGTGSIQGAGHGAGSVLIRH